MGTKRQSARWKQLEAQVRSGTYAPDPQHIAQAILWKALARAAGRGVAAQRRGS